MIAGVAVVWFGTSKLDDGFDEELRESFLAPTLAVDALDDDLRVAYMQTLVLDARCRSAWGKGEKARWATLGRELRRAIVAAQALRMQQLDDARVCTKIEATLERCDRDLERGGVPDGWEDRVDEVERVRREAAETVRAARRDETRVYADSRR